MGTPSPTIIPAGTRMTLHESTLNETPVIVEEDAQLDIVTIHQTATPVTEEKIKKITVKRGGIVRLFTGLFETGNVHVTAVLEGEHSVCEHHLVYYMISRQQARITMEVEHQGKNTFSRTLVRGVVANQARATFRGTVWIRESAQRTDTHLGHEGLLLSTQGSIDALPGLDIATNDVRATHSSAVHSIQEDQLFYLQTRGIDPQTARQMIVQGFLEEITPLIQEKEMQEQVRLLIQKRQQEMSQ